MLFLFLDKIKITVDKEILHIGDFVYFTSWSKLNNLNGSFQFNIKL